MVFDPLVSSFDSFEAATRAREALVAGGVNPDMVQIRVIQDEAGPVEGNFWVGNSRAADGGESKGIRAGPEVPYDKNFRNTVNRGVHLVMVNVTEAILRERAQGILGEFGGIDPQGRAAVAPESHDPGPT